MGREAGQQGFTLIEVLVAVVILSIGLLGLAGMQMWAVKNTGNAFFRTQATLAANEMVERIRANPAGNYSANGSACGSKPRSCVTNTCLPVQLAVDDIYSVACGITGAGDGAGLDDLLPTGRLTVACPGDCTVKVTWTEVSGDGLEQTKQLELVVTP